MSRPRQYISNAERQRAYRMRRTWDRRGQVEAARALMLSTRARVTDEKRAGGSSKGES